MIIILEGPDGAGKTTLAKQLCEKYGLVYHHEGPPPESVGALEHYGALLDRARFAEPGVVFDRLALGERVYGPIWRGRDTLGDDGWVIFRRLMSAVGAFPVLCLPSYEVCLKNWQGRSGEMIKDETIFKEIYERFSELNQGQFIYDYTGATSQLFCLYRFLEQQHLEAVLPANYVGSPYATYLFVGDVGSNPDAPFNLPFFSTENSSGYFLRALKRTDFKERELAFVNAYNNDGSANQIFNFSKVIALGAMASHACTKQQVQHQKIHHPQYWKRFHYHHIDRFVEALQSCR